MADYIQDISPEDDDVKDVSSHEESGESDESVDIPIRVAETPRGIRSITPPRSRMMPRRMGPPVPGISGRPPRRRASSWMLWVAALVALVILVLVALLALRPTTITVVPKTHTVVFDGSQQITAYPNATAAAGTLAYTVKSLELDDSEVLQAQGTTHVETKASGTITVSNETASPIKLVKTTRFQTPDGLIFRSTSDVTVPAKKTASVAVTADQTGSQYNVAPTAKFTVPGLKSSADLYAHVYGSSSAAMSGGFSGDQPAAAPGALDTALATVRSRLEAKARATAAAESAVTFPDLIHITYQDEPTTPEATGSVRIHEKASVDIPEFEQGAFATAVGQAIAIDTTGGVTLQPGKDLVASAVGGAPALGSDALTFSLSGSGTLVWNVDAAALANALAGKDQAAFQTIVNGFDGIEEAHARIEPFWNKTFPTRANDIKVTVETPPAAQK